MYISKLNVNDNLAEIHAFLHANGFGILVNQTNGKLWATHIPMVLDKNAAGQDVLTAHISIANPQWKDFTDDQPVLAIFQGPHAYISSSWYDHENVPTWNYIAVHVYGKVWVLQGDDVVDALTKLTAKYEAGSQNPVAVEKMSPDYVKKQIRGIVCFEIVIDEIQAAYKLSQNRDAKNHANVIKELEARGDAQSLAVAAAMKDRT